MWTRAKVPGLSAASGFGTSASNGTARVELFCDDPDAVIAKAAAAGAEAKAAQTHEAPWGPHRQGGFTDPFGHVWHVGDRSPLG